MALDVKLRIPGPMLDTHYQVVCTCGIRRDFGYMGTTCQRWVDQHIKKGPEHDVTQFESPAPPLTREIMLKRMKIKARRGMFEDGTIRLGQNGQTL
jgi:hypothetical protein